MGYGVKTKEHNDVCIVPRMVMKRSIYHALIIIIIIAATDVLSSVSWQVDEIKEIKRRVCLSQDPTSA